MLISIVITAYNVEKYIRKAVESAASQKGEDIEVEVVVVNDHATDNTEEILNELVKEYDNVRWIYADEINVGAGKARKAGIKKSKGEYVLLLDGDDWLDDGFIDALAKKAVETGADIVSGGVTINKPDGSSEATCYGEFILKDDDKVTRFFGERIVFMNNKLIRRTLHDQVPYCERRFIEDTPTIVPQLYLANMVAYVNVAGYHYRMVETSLTHSSSQLKVGVYRALCVKDLMNFFKDKPRGGWCNIVNINVLHGLVSQVINSKVTYEEIASYGKDWLDFTLLMMDVIKVMAKAQQSVANAQTNNQVVENL